MFNISQILPQSYKSVIAGIAVAALYNVEVGAQELRDCDRRPGRSSDESLNSVESVENFSSEEYKPERVSISNKAKSSSVKEVKENPIYKASGEKEVDQEEMSTLSFNLFIYIMDRFKED
ncbi:hypothetical protein KZP23_05060 [Echinicola marina]|uniref:hypothetical protein n=1 Tax=Echinicola marina TaxID=2859768 RepID=UPI001CF63F5B|nr:hypothetical protein [Echinicola marina]UCS94398.1 hypothetical protein KZP23_05060 [Echinicola marina]